MSYKDYLFSLRCLILFSFLVFIFFIFYGYFVAQSAPDQGKLFLERVREMYAPLFKMSPLGQFLFIVLNNGFSLVLTLLLGIIFGIFPLLVLFSNGSILGILAFFFQQDYASFFLGTLPHGVIEIPIMILACSIGLRVGKTVFQKVFQKGGEIKKELSLAFKFFLSVLLPLLILAAAIEIFITSKLLA